MSNCCDDKTKPQIVPTCLPNLTNFSCSMTPNALSYQYNYNCPQTQNGYCHWSDSINIQDSNGKIISKSCSDHSLLCGVKGTYNGSLLTNISGVPGTYYGYVAIDNALCSQLIVGGIIPLSGDNANCYTKITI